MQQQLNPPGNDNQQNIKQKRAVIIGGSGAIGRVLIEELCQSEKWSKVTIIVRRKLPQWEQIQGKEKLEIIEKQNLDCLEQAQDWNMLYNYDVFFCCLGSRVNQGKEIFQKVDYYYCLWGGIICQKQNIAQYSIVTSKGADSKSSFLYLKVKGQIEQALIDLNLKRLSIFQPGFLKNRDNDKRCGETFFKYCCCCMDGIESNDLAVALRIEAELQENLSKQPIQRYSNSDCKKLSIN